MRLYKKIYILYYYRNWFRGVCVCMGAPPIGDNKINRLFFRISVFCIVSTSDSSVYHQLYQCLRSKKGEGWNWVITQKKIRVHFGLTDGRGTREEKGWEVSLFKSSHLTLWGFISFDLRALLRCHFVYDFVRLSTFHGRLVDWLLLAPPKRGGRGRFLLHIFNIIKECGWGKSKRKGTKGIVRYGQVREKWLANLSFMYNLLNKLQTHK